MMIWTAAISTAFIMAVGLPAQEHRTPAFPGAEGFGRYATGGRGGAVIAVTNLDDSGPGSLRSAILEKGPRTVIFRVSGTIVLKSPLEIQEGNLTIAGQTAPGDGICLRDYPTVVAAQNVVIRYLRFRLGDETRMAEDALTVMRSRNVIVDHCSMSWGMDEAGSFYDNEDFTLQWSIISESLYDSFHPKGAHGYGGIWGGIRASFAFNLLAHHSSRNPRFNGDRTLESGRELVDFRNNLVYNWGFHCAYGGEEGRQNLVANYFKPGPATVHPSYFLEPWDDDGQWYVEGNVVEGAPTVTRDNREGIRGSYRTDGLVTKPFPAEPMITIPADSVPGVVVRFAGAVLPRRDAVDTRIVNEAAAGTATFGGQSYGKDHKERATGPLGIIDSQSEVGGWPLLAGAAPPRDSDRDGMPDDWEKGNGLDPEDPADGPRLAADGYTNLERYLNDLATGPWIRFSTFSRSTP